MPRQKFFKNVEHVDWGKEDCVKRLRAPSTFEAETGIMRSPSRQAATCADLGPLGREILQQELPS